MKTQMNRWWRIVGFLAWLLAGTAGVSRASAQTSDPTAPTIAASWMEKNEVVVVVDIPRGLRKITLESQPRVGTGSWQPRLVQRLDGQGGRMTFRLKAMAELELLRIRGDSQDPLPASFYAGSTNFNGQGTSYDPASGLAGGVNTVLSPTSTVDDKSSTTTTRDVVESDIWKISGTTLYFFNQYRGLQVIDLTHVDAPVIRNTLYLPASGEQMYLLGNQYVILLAQDRYNSTNGYQSEVLVVDVQNVPRVVAKLPLLGSVQESRMVGTALYVASQYYRPVTPTGSTGSSGGTTSTVSEWGSLISAFDLANPAQPIARDPLWLSGYGNVIYATDEYLFMATQDPKDYWQSILHIVDISNPDGTMEELTALRPGGRVGDKYKMNFSQGVFSVICEQGISLGTTSQRVSLLQTYSLANPSAPSLLGRLELGRGDSLYATRFDGDRAYVVTYLRVDPLWVVDLRNPAKPQISGELHVPGWSTFIYPLGDRLVTIGIDNTNSWKVAISLFDVADPTKPGLLSKVPLGENSSWSEATYDDKAFTVLPDAGLVLVPYQSWGTNGYVSRVQIIDLNRDSLKARGVIDHSMQPRRAAAYVNRLLTLSGSELLTVNAADRDHPLLTSELELSWPVNRVVLAGNYLIEVADSGSWTSTPEPRLHIASSANVNQLLSTVSFTNGLPILGITSDGGRLFVLQGNGTQPWFWLAAADGGSSSDNAVTNKAVLSVFDLGTLPQLKRVGYLEAPSTSMVSGAFTAQWPKKDLLVWSSSGGRVYPLIYSVAKIGAYYPWTWGQGGRLLAFGVADATAPQFYPEVNLANTNGGWNFSAAQTANGLVYLSHQASEFLTNVVPSWYQKPSPVTITNPDGTTETRQAPVGIWVTKYFLDVVDYANPLLPLVRKPVAIPGELLGLSYQGALVYTLGPHYQADWTSDSLNYLDAGAYDGVSVALVDSLKLTNSYPKPLVLASGKVLTLQYPNSTASVLQTWDLSMAGKFIKLGEKAVAGQGSAWRAFSDLLVLQLYDRIDLYDVSIPATPVYLNGAVPPGWTWPDINNGDATRGQGTFLPLADYGVLAVPSVPTP
jgi:hypothetical protein